jgi:hypothetical protein
MMLFFLLITPRTHSGYVEFNGEFPAVAGLDELTVAVENLPLSRDGAVC